MRVVEIHGPADEPFVRLVRIASLSFASQAGLPIDPCDEIRMAIDEVCRALVDSGALSLTVTFTEGLQCLRVEICGPAPVAPRFDPVATLVLKAMTDRFHVGEDGSVVLEKSLQI